MLKKYTCVVCGSEFWAENMNAKYCTPHCKSVANYARQKNREKERQAERAAAFERAVAYMRGDGTLVCNGCQWKSHVDHHKCVMPSCLKGLGAAHDRR